MTPYTFTLDLCVFDPAHLHAAAVRRALEDGLTDEEVFEIIGHHSAPSIEGCISMLLDPGSLPGCNIDSSSAERLENF